MSSSQQIGYLLWDFGDTLAKWCGGESSEWVEAYSSIGWREDIGPGWSVGKVEDKQAVTYLGELLGKSDSEVLAHLMRADLFKLFPFTYEYFRSRHLPQSVVTVNPPLFREMAHSLGLNDVSDTIVISGEEGTIDKGVLCQTALRRVGLEIATSRILLIDNKQANLDAWRACGGVGYLYTSDSTFQRNVRDGIQGLVSSCGGGT